ncbi:Serine/threonine-protein kinase Nek1 [Symbiodinium microadriaticum]|uniref:non-specific serine/threonine protein kinase n=1 Tax=Symbiodinium microadriaticum TaxID=2951 RepID=A0A1Q9DZC5_SYMMI|nr:Serine/threonine-protein kinase Nek1 [Symbiodinium microadriaticum]
MGRSPVSLRDALAAMDTPLKHTLAVNLMAGWLKAPEGGRRLTTASLLEAVEMSAAALGSAATCARAQRTGFSRLFSQLGNFSRMTQRSMADSLDSITGVLCGGEIAEDAGVPSVCLGLRRGTWPTAVRLESAAMLSSGTLLLQKYGYKEIRKIGEGAFGQAILVEDESGSKLVCKMVDVSQASPKEVQDARKEAQLLAAFKHPFIVDYRTNFLESGYLCILMCFCEGGDLATQINLARDARRRLPEPQILRWMTQALLALKYIHDKHVLHRAGGSATLMRQSMTSAYCLWPYYLSPEVCQEKPYAWPADIWAMGIILYELCALKLPFDGGSNMVILVQSILRGTAPPLPEEYSEFTRTLCSEMLSKAPARRPTAGAILGRPPMHRIVQSFFDEAKAKVARDEATPSEPLEVGPPAVVAPPPQPAGQAAQKAPLPCVTQLLDEMLGESDSTEASQPPPPRLEEAVGIAGAVSLEDECTELLAELGLVEEDKTGSLTQAELDLLNGSMQLQPQIRSRCNMRPERSGGRSLESEGAGRGGKSKASLLAPMATPCRLSRCGLGGSASGSKEFAQLWSKQLPWPHASAGVGVASSTLVCVRRWRIRKAESGENPHFWLSTVATTR